MRVRYIAVPVFVFVTALIENAGLIAQAVDAVMRIQFFHALNRIIPISGHINVMSFFFEKFQSRFIELETGGALTTIVSTE